MTDKSKLKKRLGRPRQSSTCRRVPLREIQKHITKDATVLANQNWLEAVGVDYHQTK